MGRRASAVYLVTGVPPGTACASLRGTLLTPKHVPRLAAIVGPFTQDGLRDVAKQQVANRVFSGLVLAGLLIATAQRLPYWRGLGTAGFVIASVWALYMVLTIIVSDRANDRERQG